MSLKSRTVLEAILNSLGKAAVHNSNVMVAPAAILWPDEQRQWLPLLPLLRETCPYLLTLGEYNPEERTGPAIWIRCMLGRQLDAAEWPADAVPVVYLPGVSRAMLRAVESSPKYLQPLAELQYSGVLWSQLNSRDWTLLAFLKSQEGGLGLDVAQDARTLEAMSRALLQLADTPIDQLQGRRLEAPDFDRLLTTDPVRDILRWLNDPTGTRNRWSKEVWGAFRSVCKADFECDPQMDGELVAAELLGEKKGKWQSVWDRFAESPHLYPGIPELLRKAQPKQLGLGVDHSPWPGINDGLEAVLRKSLLVLENQAPYKATTEIEKLEDQHSQRRMWVWAELGAAPLAQALEHLTILSEVAKKVIGGSTPEEMAVQYAEWGWRADAAALEVLACVKSSQDFAAAKAALRAIYLPWLETTAEKLQSMLRQGAYPAGEMVPAELGTCLLFVDGLRMDLGYRLKSLLEARGHSVHIGARWTAIPSVTATGKPDVSPVATQVIGGASDSDFTPHVASTKKPLNLYHFQKLLEDMGIQHLDRDTTGEPTGKGWSEHGNLDQTGHEQGWKLARRIVDELRELIERIECLLTAGWKKIQVITDHGWLLVPGGLPGANLPHYLAETRWGRCALLKPGATPSDMVVSWRWSSEVAIALAPGICCYRAGMEYAHGGLSLQECLTPVITITGAAAKVSQASIREVIWRGLRCRIAVEGGKPGMLVDLRTKPADPDSTIAGGGKPIGEDGRASVVVEDDSLIGTAAAVVVLNAGGVTIAKAATTVGSEE